MSVHYTENCAEPCDESRVKKRISLESIIALTVDGEESLAVHTDNRPLEFRVRTGWLRLVVWLRKSSEPYRLVDPQCNSSCKTNTGPVWRPVSWQAASLQFSLCQLTSGTRPVTNLTRSIVLMKPNRRSSELQMTLRIWCSTNAHRTLRCRMSQLLLFN